METLSPPVVKLSSKFQVVIPAELRDDLGWRPGEEIAVMIDGDGTVVLRRVPTIAEIRERLKGRITVPFERDKEHG